VCYRAGPLVETLADDAIALGDNTPNPRVGMSCIQTPLGERQSPRHREAVEFSEHYITSLDRPPVTFT
jgi:hypothetical protein